MKKLISSVFVLSLLMTMSFQMTIAKPIVFGVPDFFPFSNSASQTHAGIFNEMIEQVMTQIDEEYEIRVRPFARINQEFEEGIIDISLGFKKKGGRVLLEYGCHFNIFVPHIESEVLNIEDINKKRVGFVNGGVYSRIYSSKFQTINTFVSSDESLFKMLLANRIDGFFISNVVMDGYVKYGVPTANLADDWFLSISNPVVISSSNVSFHISEKSELSESLIHQITLAIELIHENDTFNKIYKNYGVKNGADCNI